MTTLLLICFLAGGVGSILQGMVGIGTGIIIVPLLYYTLPRFGIPPAMAMHIGLGTSMAAIAVNSVTALISHHKRGNINWLLFKKIFVFSVFGAILGAFSASFLSGRCLEFTFGIFLLLLAFYMMLKSHPTDEITSISDTSYPIFAIGGLGIGFIASILGSGGGVLMVPFLHAKKVKMRFSVGTSTLLGFPTALIGALTYSFVGMSKVNFPYTFGFLHWPSLLAISLAGLFGAPLGVKLASLLPPHIVQRVFAICMGIVGCKMLCFS